MAPHLQWGSPNYFVQADDDAWGFSQDQLQVWEFHVDWTSPNNSTFIGPTLLATAPFDTDLCGYSRSCIPQPGTEQGLDAISDRLMFRLQYRSPSAGSGRRFGSHQTLVVNHTVDADGGDRAGIRWYELRDSGGGWSIYQQGTYAPDSDHRWMGSIAMDVAGNMALGYSVSSGTTYPSIRYAGRLAGDAPGTLPQAEKTLIAGGGSQTHNAARWGDYSMMAVDPTDDCTFWYTQEYYATTSSAGWQTRIGSFKFPSCTSGPTGTLEGTVTDAATGAPIGGATVTAGVHATVADASGVYRFLNLPVDTYDVTASAYGYSPNTVTGVVVTDGGTIIQDFALSPLLTVTIDGTVTDGSGHSGLPLYARIDIADYPGSPVFTDPVTGYYSVSLFEGVTYAFSVSAVSGGYNAEVRAVVPPAGGSTEDFALTMDTAACSAPGYQAQYVYFEDFEVSDGGFITSGITSWEWGAPASGPGVAHSGTNVWATNLDGNYGNDEDGYTLSPDIDLSAYAGQTPILSWWQWLETESGFDFASVEVSNDGGATWTRVHDNVSGSVDTVWTKHDVVLDPGYAVSNFRARFRLRSDGSVTDSGYYVDDIGIGVVTIPPPTVAYTEDFETDDGAFTANGTTSWEWGAPASGPGVAHSGTNVWATNLDGDYGNDEDGYTLSPDIDLSAYAGQTPILSWWQWLETESGFDFASVEVSNDGGATWTRVYGELSGSIDTAWGKSSVTLDSGYAVSDFRARFRLRSDGSVTAPGYYVDDVTVEILSGPPPAVHCDPLMGGLVVGNVYDANRLSPIASPNSVWHANTGMALNRATVDDGLGNRATTFATPDDPAVDDGFYILFSSPGSQTLTATISGGYGADVQTPTVIQDNTIRQEFNLPAGWLSYSPPALEATSDLGTSTTVPFTLTNNGGIATTFEFREANRGALPRQPGGVLPYKRRSVSYWDPLEMAPLSDKKTLRPDTWATGSTIPTGPRYRAAGASCDDQSYYVFGGWDSNNDPLAEAWKYDPDSDTWTALADMPVALANMEATCIDGLIYLVGGYTGTAHTNSFQIYDTVNDTWLASTWPNARSPMTAAWEGKLYAIGGNPGPSDETWVYDPATTSWTGPLAPMPTATTYGAATTVDDYIFVVGGGNSDDVQRYDPINDVWDATGPALPAARMNAILVWYGDLLYAASGGGAGGDPWTAYDDTLTLDPAAWPGGAWTNQGETVRTPVVGAAYDCTKDRIYAAGGTNSDTLTDANQYLDDNRNCNFANIDVPWLSEEPITGTIPALGELAVDITFDTSVPEITYPGQYFAKLRVKDDTPYSVAGVPVTMTVNAPTTHGKLAGTVSSLGYCDINPSPLAGTDVFIESGTGMTWTLATDLNGAYQVWLDEANSPLTVTVTHPDHKTGQATGVAVAAQTTTTLDIDLRWLRPCASLTPNSLDVVVGVGLSVTVPVTLTNAGAGNLLFSIAETTGLSAGNGPDPFGYTYMDSSEPGGGPRFDWIEIAPPCAIRRSPSPG